MVDDSQSDKQIRRLYVHLARNYDGLFVLALCFFEVALGVAIIRFVAYTEIDWDAYMQEVDTWMSGEYDYRNIRGDTGPLVYPAGFLYLYRWLRRLTNQGTDVRAAQFIFLAFYVVTQLIVWRIYLVRLRSMRLGFKGGLVTLQQAHQIWAWRVGMATTCLSKRLHSIFLLRLFNDGPTMLLLYASVLSMTHNFWNVGCLIFSLAVSIKMNVLLFAPGLLLLLLQASPNSKAVVLRLAFGCALPQLVLGAPFLLRFPLSYLRKAFELDRVFFYKWTVNWKVRERFGVILVVGCYPSHGMNSF